eukprot:jgi/Hompol1/5331/HPOL_001941-RA
MPPPPTEPRHKHLPYMTQLEPLAFNDHQAELFATLNMCILRAYAVNTFADGYFVELVRVTHKQGAVAEFNNALRKDQATVRNPSRMHPAILGEEAVSLYVYALGLYQSGMELAKQMWDQEQERALPTHSMLISRFGFGRASVTAASVDIAGPSVPSGYHPSSSTGQKPASIISNLSIVVQWIRDRFNECIAKADNVRSHLAATNHETFEESAELAAGGVSPCPAEKLIYDYALHISQVAALNELHQVDLDKCEAAYQNAVLLLESLLNNNANSSTSSMTSSSVSPAPVPLKQTAATGNAVATDNTTMDELTDDDRVTIEKFLVGLYARLTALQNRAGSK